jgi:tRNA(adenine34) deaminase
MRFWESLDASWRVCLELAWESYVHGSLPIAAVIVDETGAVVARGRNRLQDKEGAPNVLHRHPLAHAEVNALLDFPFGRVMPERCTLLTNLEPCPLCVGAVRMSHIGALVYAARDPWAGVTRLFETDAYIGQKGIAVSSLAGSLLEVCVIALQTEAHLRGARSGGVPNEPHFFETWRAVLPLGVAAGERLFALQALPECVRAGADAAHVFQVIEGMVLEATQD